jgi:hypothetical protein
MCEAVSLPHLVSGLRMHQALSSLLVYAFMSCLGTGTLIFTFAMETKKYLD